MLRYVSALFAGFKVALARLPLPLRKCNFCGRQFTSFLPYRGGQRSLPKLLVALEVVGSDVQNFSCPYCRSHDRERHLYFYMEATGEFDYIAGRHVLYFAPEQQLVRHVEAASPKLLVKCDKFTLGRDIIPADMLNLPFRDRVFDLVIANHVLEHVLDVEKALSEISRVLIVGGHAILQTPYSPILEKTWEDPGICTDAARLEAFGQEDHLRLFGNDFVLLVRRAGLVWRGGGHHEILGAISSEKFGLNRKEPYLFFEKTNS